MKKTVEKGAGFLKFIVVYKVLTGVAALILSAAFFELRGGDLSDVLRHLSVSLDIYGNPVIRAAVREAAMISGAEVKGLTAAIFAVGVLNNVEAVGLYLRQRWAEWLTVAATAVFIPFEVYEIIIGVSAVKTAALVLNCLIVYYLATRRELFKGREGKAGGV